MNRAFVDDHEKDMQDPEYAAAYISEVIETLRAERRAYKKDLRSGNPSVRGVAAKAIQIIDKRLSELKEAQ